MTFSQFLPDFCVFLSFAICLLSSPSIAWNITWPLLLILFHSWSQTISVFSQVSASFAFSFLAHFIQGIKLVVEHQLHQSLSVFLLAVFRAFFHRESQTSLWAHLWQQMFTKTNKFVWDCLQFSIAGTKSCGNVPPRQPFQCSLLSQDKTTVKCDFSSSHFFSLEWPSGHCLFGNSNLEPLCRSNAAQCCDFPRSRQHSPITRFVACQPWKGTFTNFIFAFSSNNIPPHKS